MKKLRALIIVAIFAISAIPVIGGDLFPPFAGPNYMGFSVETVTLGDVANTTVWVDVHRSIDTVAMDNFTFLPVGVLSFKNATRGNLFAGYDMWITPHYIHNESGWAKAIMWAYSIPVNTTNSTAFHILWDTHAVGTATITITKGGTARNGTDPGTTKYTGTVNVYPQTTSGFDASPTSPTNIHLAWGNGQGMDRTVIRGSQSSYPTTPQSGTAIFNSSGTSYNHGVGAGQTWYYSVWGWNSTVGWFSLTHQQDTATTPASNHAPNAPFNPSPVNNTPYMNVYNIYLNCTVTDPDGDTMSVHYYWGNGSSIGTITGVANNTVSSLYLPDYWHRSGAGGYNNLTWVIHDVNHTWYAVADDSLLTTQGPTWHFKTCKSWDLQADRHVNLLDLSLFVSHYALSVRPPGKDPWDINEDTYTNLIDLSLFVSHYALSVRPPGKDPWDINEDMYTNLIDLSTLVSHYGENY